MAPLTPACTPCPRPRTVFFDGPAFWFAALIALARPADAQFTDFMAMDLAELSDVRTTTLGRTENAVVDYPAAATVLNHDDIRRTGATNLAEALRNVPGLHAARVDAFDYAVSIRGFNDTTSSKLLVVADGRSLRDGTFTGTNWGFQEIILGDLERIEVLRGPGASLWGANAMNGFINIVSKSARDTLGAYVSAGTGDHLNDFLEVRQGWMIDDATAARVYFKTQSHDGFDHPAPPSTDQLRTHLLGGRIDHTLAGGARLSVIGEWRHGTLSGQGYLPTLVPPYVRYYADHRTADTYNLSARFEHKMPWWDGTFSAFANLEHSDDTRLAFGERRRRTTLDLQSKLHPLPGHEILAGFTYERNEDDLSSTDFFSFRTPSETVTLAGAFLQDDIELVPRHLRATVGAKIEQNTYSGWEFQPSIRAIWSPHPAHRVWAGWSQAARTPSRTERSIDYFVTTVPPGPDLGVPIAVTALGSPDFDSEHVSAFELGYRFHPRARFTTELTVFYNDYSDLRGFRQDDAYFSTELPPHVISEIVLANNVQGHTRGGELNLRWQVNADLLLEASQARVVHDLASDVALGDLLQAFAVDVYHHSSPQDVTKFRVAWNPRPDWEIDTTLRHTASQPGGAIPDYTALDLRLAWHPHPAWEIALLARDLLKPVHREQMETLSQTSVPNIDRSFELRVTFRR